VVSSPTFARRQALIADTPSESHLFAVRKKYRQIFYAQNYPVFGTEPASSLCRVFHELVSAL